MKQYTLIINIFVKFARAHSRYLLHEVIVYHVCGGLHRLRITQLIKRSPPPISPFAINQQTPPLPHKGRGPVAVEDVATNRPRLRLPLPSSSEPAPFGAISSRVSNGSARQNDGGGSTVLRTERSDISAASGSQAGGGGGGNGSGNGQARGGRAFMTQK